MTLLVLIPYLENERNSGFKEGPDRVLDVIREGMVVMGVEEEGDIDWMRWDGVGWPAVAIGLKPTGAEEGKKVVNIDAANNEKCFM